MICCSTDNLIVRAAFTLLMLALACNAFALDSGTPEQALRSLGAQVKLASDHADAGRLPTHAAIANLERTLAGFRETAAEDSVFERKFQAITLLFDKLKYQTAHPQSVPAKAAIARAQMDMEVLSATHGATCATAFGISEALPVKVALAQSGDAGSEAWFRFETAAAGHFRFKTDSSGPDPAIEIFRGGCTAEAASIAANDDTFGLDAVVSVAAADHAGLMVHVTNSAAAGLVELSVQAVDATISGRITDAATALPISGAQVGVFNTNGNFLFVYAYTDQDGNYSLSVSPNTYYVRAMYSQYVAKLYPNAQCGYNSDYYDLFGCPVAQAQTVTVASGATVSNVDIALNKGNRISGVVRDSSNQPVSSASVYISDVAGTQLGGTNADGFGRYSFSTLPAGSYKLAAQANGYGSQIWNGIACGGPFQTQCDLSQASVINIVGQDVGGVSFRLPVLATIQGNLSGPPLQPLNNVNVVVLDSVGNYAAQTYTDSSGHYRAGPLPIGNYYVYATAAGYFSQIFNGIDCAQDCSSSIPVATAIAITQARQVGVADFRLTPLPVVHGHIQDAASGLPLTNVTIAASIYPPASFSTVSWTTTDSNGNYTLTGTPAGQYYLWAQSNDHVDQIYSGIACEAPPNYYPQNPSCDVSGATQLLVSPGQTPSNFDFALQAASSISGKAIIRAGLGSDLPAASVQISVYNGAGVVVSSANADSLGNYLVNDLPAGTYFVSAGTSYYYNQYVTQVWQLIDCPSNCAATAGTPVVAGPGSAVTAIDFLLTRRDAVVGRVTDSLGAPISGVLIDLFDAANNTYRATAATDAQGFYAVAWNSGYSYFVATEVNGGYVDQVYSGVSCPLGPAYFGLCPFTNATAVALTNGSSQPHIANFVLPSNDPVFSNGFE